MPLVNKHILAIDDTASIRTFLRISLKAQGAAFHEAGTASEGMQMCEQIRPDVVVLDLGLPDRDGLDFLPELKQCTKNGVEPIVVILSVRKEQHTKNQAFALGADAYVTKPFLMEELIEVIEQNIRARAS